MNREFEIALIASVFSLMGAGIVWILFNNEFATWTTFCGSIGFSIVELYLVGDFI